MPPQNSSTSNSDAKRSPGGNAPGAGAFAWRDLLATTAWFLLFLALFELVTWAIFTRPRLADSALRQYLWYGTSYETKLREFVNTPDLPANSVLYAGWLGDGRLRSLPNDVDITVYGMSFSANLGEALRELRPQLTQRFVGGPGAPLSHTYAIYQVDKKLRKTRYAVLGVTSGAVQEVLLMNRGSLFSDAPFPYFFPRYRMDGDRVVLGAASLINSADELRAAFNHPALWERQLAVLAANDSAYRRFFFAHDVLDYSVLGRFVRRAMSKRHAADYASKVLGADGFNRENEAPRLFRGLLRQMVRELRAENVQPIVVLFALQGHRNDLYDLVADILRDEAVPYVNSFDVCRSDDRDNYQPDMHFVRDCNMKFGQRTLQIVDAVAKAAAPGVAPAP
jgi:hypothetical protein